MPGRKNGEVDYPAKIHALSAYQAPSCREILETDARRRKDAGELLDRVRVVYEIPEHGYGGRYNRDPVTVEAGQLACPSRPGGGWYFHAEPVKRALIRYPMKVMRMEGDRA